MIVEVTFPKKQITSEPTGGGGIPAEGDMTKAVYDPDLIEGDAFDMSNMKEAEDALILTNEERENIEAAHDHSLSEHAPVGAKDNILEGIDYTFFPIEGSSDILYVDLTNDIIYRWSGSAYVKVSRTNSDWNAENGPDMILNKPDLSRKADLEDGVVPAAQLPGYVDDVLEFERITDLPELGEAGKIYVVKDTNLTYRWSGTGYVEISQSLALGETSATAYRGDRGKTAYDHSQSAHAPANAQKNSDITKEEIEAKLTGEIASHSHEDKERGFTIAIGCFNYGPIDNTTYYFSNAFQVPGVLVNTRPVYVRKNCILKIAELTWTAGGAAGTNENISIYIRKNNSEDILIATIGNSQNIKIFSNTLLNTAFNIDDYFEIKIIHPTWATNPTSVYIGGYLYFQLS